MGFRCGDVFPEAAVAQKTRFCAPGDHCMLTNCKNSQYTSRFRPSNQHSKQQFRLFSVKPLILEPDSPILIPDCCCNAHSARFAEQRQRVSAGHVLRPTLSGRDSATHRTCCTETECCFRRSAYLPMSASHYGALSSHSCSQGLCTIGQVNLAR